jgi:hypothetical protein
VPITKCSYWLPAGRQRDRSSSPGGLNNLHFSISFISALGPTQTLHNGYLRQPRSEVDLISQYCRGQQDMDLYIHSSILLHSLVFNWSGTGTASFLYKQRQTKSAWTITKIASANIEPLFMPQIAFIIGKGLWLNDHVCYALRGAVVAHTRTLDSLFVASYDSQGYGGGILVRLHTGQLTLEVEVEVNLRPTVSRPVCLGAGLPCGAHDQIFVFCLIIAGFFMWGTLSDERTGLQFTVQLLLGLARAVTLGSKSRRTHDHILLSHLRLQGQFHVFISLSNRVAKLYPWPLSSLEYEYNEIL